LWTAKRCDQMAVELLLNLHVLGLQHANPLFGISLINFFVHGFPFDNLLGDVKALAGAFLVQHRGPIGRL
jgi:hypothetical protein